MSVYEQAEALLRAKLQGRRADFRERCVALAMWLIRAHGPYAGRLFAVPRYELAADEKFQGRVGLTYSQIRTATEALIEIGLLVRISEPRSERRRKDPPTQFEVGTDFALLFPVATRHKESLGFKIKAPLFVATYKNPIPRPVHWDPPRPKTDRDLALATLAALRAQPVPKLSAGVLRGFEQRR